MLAKNKRMANDGIVNSFGRCVASNSEGSDDVTVQVAVEAKPYFENEDDKPRKQINLYPGQSATVNCKPRGIPAPEVEWRLNAKPIGGLC